MGALVFALLAGFVIFAALASAFILWGVDSREGSADRRRPVGGGQSAGSG